MRTAFLKLMLPAALLVTGLSSCIFNSIKCENPMLGLNFSGYDSTEVANVIIREFVKNSDLTNPQRTVYCRVVGPFAADTLSIENANNDHEFRLPEHYFILSQDHDYTIEIVAAGRTHKLTGLTFGHNKGPDANHGCINSASWYMDGKYVHFDSYTRYIGPTGLTPTVIK